jgi:hypothetical protein
LPSDILVSTGEVRLSPQIERRAQQLLCDKKLSGDGEARCLMARSPAMPVGIRANYLFLRRNNGQRNNETTKQFVSYCCGWKILNAVTRNKDYTLDHSATKKAVLDEVLRHQREEITKDSADLTKVLCPRRSDRASGLRPFKLLIKIKSLTPAKSRPFTIQQRAAAIQA